MLIRRGFSLLIVWLVLLDIPVVGAPKGKTHTRRKVRRKTKMSGFTDDESGDGSAGPDEGRYASHGGDSDEKGRIDDPDGNGDVTPPTRRLPIGLTMCGRRPTNPYRRNRRVVGGLNAGTPWPWQAQIIRRDGTRRETHHCGGTLIDSMHVLTAAHCFEGYHKDDFLVRLGQHDRSLTEPAEQDLTIGCLDVHPHYRRLRKGDQGFANDIALITLRGINGHRGALFNDYILPACLPQPDEFATGSDCWVTGWGYSNFTDLVTSSFPDVLNEAPVPLQPQKLCRSVYGKQSSSKTLCAGQFGNRAARTDTCQGDSGGPLVCTRYGVWKLWGITSWGMDTLCIARPRGGAVPGVYTRVDRYLHWIERRRERRREKPVCIN